MPGGATRASFWLFLGLTLILAALTMAPFARLLGNSDEGVALAAGLRIAHGQVPYSGFWEFYAPGTDYLAAGVIALWGASFLPARILVIAVVTLLTGLTFVLARLDRGTPVALCTALLIPVCAFPNWGIFSHHWFSSLAALASIAAVVRSCQAGSLWWRTIAGWCVGLTGLFTQSKAVYLLLALLLFLIADHRFSRGASPHPQSRLAASLGATAAGAASVAAVACLCFLLLGSLHDYLYYTTIYLYRGYLSIPANHTGFLQQALTDLDAALRSHRTYDFGKAFAAFALIVGPFTILICALLVAVRSGLAGHYSAARARLLLYALAGLSMEAAVWQRLTTTVQLFILPVVGLCALQLFPDGQALGWRRADLPIWAGRAAAALLLAVLLADGAQLQRYRREKDVAIETRAGTVYDSARPILFGDSSSQIAAATQRAWLVAIEARVPPGQRTAILPYLPLYYFLADVRNATRYDLVQFQLPDELGMLVRDLHEHEPRYVFLPPGGLPASVGTYLRAGGDYRLQAIVAGMAILERTSPGH